MSNRKASVVEEGLSPNLIPMLDIMFLLLLFFMLGSDMGRREKEELVLPTADRAQEPDPRTGVDRQTTINIHHSSGASADCPVADNGGVCRDPRHWKWSIRGREYDASTITSELAMLADSSREPGVDRRARKFLSARKILIRADRDAPYGDVQGVIEDCGRAGLYKIEIAAAEPVAARVR